MTARPAVQSPCNDVCRMDAASGLCLGCWRTIDEIAAWPALDDARRIALLAELPARRARVRSERARKQQGHREGHQP